VHLGLEDRIVVAGVCDGQVAGASRVFMRIRQRFIWSTVVVAIILMGIAALLNFPSLGAVKLVAVNFYSSAPFATVRLGVREAIKKADFDRALHLLKSQEGIAMKIGNTSFMTQDLIEHSDQVFRLARLVGEGERFHPWIRYLAKKDPLSVRASIALKLVEFDEGLQVDIGGVSQSLGIDARIHRSQIAAVSRGSSVAEKVRSLCRSARTSQEGRYDHWFFPEKFPNAQGFSRPILSLSDNTGLSYSYPSREPLRLGGRTTSSFEFANTLSPEKFRLFLPWPIGTQVQLHQIDVTSENDTKSFRPEEIDIEPLEGFLLGKTTYLIAGDSGETLRFKLPQASDIEASRITVEFTVERLPLNAACVETQ
jgi:hypothetical protein